MAHELAHILVRRGYGPSQTANAEERFADSFATELLAPSAAVDGLVCDGRATMQIANEFDVSEAIVILQLMRLGRLEPVAHDGGGAIVCLLCGVRPPRASCRCIARRRAIPAVQGLPTSA